ncbi:MAG TPA: hypothetical protein VKI61_08910 [Chitinophagaceae bacterium]|jgi:hypothetical protein|nr:hypothetical protein [Chitinophagaceae bacterium]
MKLNHFTILLILIACFKLPACTNQKTTAQLKTDFTTRKKSFDKIVRALRNNKKWDSLLSNRDYQKGNMKYSAPALYDSLKRLGVTEIISYLQVGCKKIRQYDFKTDWDGQYPIHFAFDSCDSTTRSGFYRIDENANEFWGLGDDWKMWREVKLLRPKQ